MQDLLSDIAWKDGTNKKRGDLIALLEQRARTYITMLDFDLSYAKLENINLVNSHKSFGFQLKNCDLYKANLKNAHCFKVDFSGSSLMKANLENANLHFANLKDCNLLGCNLKNAKLENVVWGDEILQEKQANEANDPKTKYIYFQQAEEIYRNLRRNTESDGLFETAGYFFQKEMKMRRMQMNEFSSKRLVSRVVELFCGYGEKPLRIISISLMIILFFSFLFFIFGINYSDNIIIYSSNNSFNENLNYFFTSLYFSVVTFTTLGYGDIVPIGITRLFAALEALLGGFILALFVVVFVKKMTR